MSICTSAETYLQCHETVFSKGINAFFTHFFFNNTNNVSFLSFFPLKAVQVYLARSPFSGLVHVNQSGPTYVSFYYGFLGNCVHGALGVI